MVVSRYIWVYSASRVKVFDSWSLEFCPLRVGIGFCDCLSNYMRMSRFSCKYMRGMRDCPLKMWNARLSLENLWAYTLSRVKFLTC